jgi:two-component system osmolarity sensor histidine kinase EnvZ
VFYDLSGPTLQAALAAGVPGLQFTAFDAMRGVTVWIDGAAGPMTIAFDRRRVSASNPHQLLVLMGVLSVLMTLIAYLFLRNQLRPIKRLSLAATEYGKGRQAPFHPSGATEVRAAGTAFLDMRQRIERQAQTRTLMLSGVSHDLRTPLTRLRLGLSLLDDAEAAGMIRDVDEMTRMVDSFLDFARADAMAETGDPMEPADAGALVADVVGRAGQGVALAPVEGLAAPVPLRPLAVRRAVENLIGNARRHGRQVLVTLAYTDRTLRISVEDDGPGIPADRREEAIRPFVRLDPARHGSGVGLGLAIVADIARAHGGVLRLGQSDRLGGLRADLVLAR